MKKKKKKLKRNKIYKVFNFNGIIELKNKK